MDKLVYGNLEITEKNYKDLCKRCALPYCFFENQFNKRPIMNINDVKVAFYDIETTSDMKFLFGYVNDKRFDDPKELVKEIQNYAVAVSFNGFRYDNVVLKKLVPELFESFFVNRFEAHLIKGVINIDALIFYRLWKPFRKSHKLVNLAREFGIEKEFNLDDKDNKCREDVMILEHFWICLEKIAGWIYENFWIDPTYLSAMNWKQINKLRRWFYQLWYLREYHVEPSLIKRSCKDQYAKYFTHHVPGFYKDINVFDVKSAYPTTAIKLGISLYGGKDFARFEEWLISEREANPKIQETIKWVCNAIIGDMNCTDGMMYDKGIMSKIWNTFHGYMIDWTDKIGIDNIVYSYTDCVMTSLDSLPDFIEPFKVALKAEYEWLVIYNIGRLLALKKDGNIHRVHFNRVPAILKMYDYVEEIIDKKLREDPVGFITNPFIDIDLKGFPKDAFSLVIMKNDEYCHSPDYLEIWADLKIGFNDVYYTKGGSVTSDFSKIDFKHYEKLLKNYLKLYKFGGVLDAG